MADFRELQKQIHDNAVNKGFYDGEPRTFGDLVSLVHCELSEAVEEFRKRKGFTETYYREDGKPEGIPSELADVVIRVMDMCEFYGIDLWSIIEEKCEFNKTRPYKHGNKAI